MVRPCFVFLLAGSVVCASAGFLHAQAVALVPGSTSSGSSSSTSTPTTSNAAPVDFSQLSWRFGQLSPYAQPSLTGSTATTTTPAPTTAPSNNPYVAPAITMNSGLVTTTSGSTSSSPTTTTSPSAAATSSIYSPRFISFSNVTHDYGVNTTINTPVNTSNSTNTTGFYDLGTTGGASASSLVAVPEPGTLLLCGGILALVGYGYSRRKGVQPAVAAPTETTEPVPTAQS